MKKNIFSKITKIFSILFQPLLIPIYSICLLSYYTSFYDLYKNGILSFLFPIFLLSFLVPALGILILRSLHVIQSLSIKSKKERVFPLIIYIISNICLCYFFLQVQVPYWYIGLLFVGVTVAFFVFIINLFWKISIHMTAIGALIGSALAICLKIFALSQPYLFIILFVLSGMLGVSRLYLRASTPSQVYVGFILGLFLGFMTIIMSVLFYY